ncbi:MAG: acyltransferase [Clostridium sp.]|nr:acyltransferase [Clostridium sp.]MCM1398476.1 acyltransferase [Clostridium sp.]MCM1460198.1 acyltransferase [Bacteroides sp.]
MKFSKNDTWAVKGFAICIMMFHHLFLEEDRFAGFDVNFAPFTQNQMVNLAVMCKICVSLFAFLTGYGLFLSYNNQMKNKHDGHTTDKWCLSRYIKTMSGFWFIYIVCFLVTMLIDRYPWTMYFKGNGTVKGTLYCLIDFLGLAPLLKTPDMCGTWWYMAAATIFIMLIPILWHIAKRTGWLPILVLALLYPRLIGKTYLGGTNAMTFVPAVILGMMFASYGIFEHISTWLDKMGKLWKTIFCWLISVLGIIMGYLVQYNFEKNEMWRIKLIFLSLIFILFVKYCLVPIKWVNGFFVFMGKRSMTIFMTHSFLRTIYLHDWIYSQGHFLKIYLALFVSSLLLAIVLDAVKHVIGLDKAVDKLCRKIMNETPKTKEA